MILIGIGLKSLPIPFPDKRAFTFEDCLLVTDVQHGEERGDEKDLSLNQALVTYPQSFVFQTLGTDQQMDIQTAGSAFSKGRKVGMR